MTLSAFSYSYFDFYQAVPESYLYLSTVRLHGIINGITGGESIEVENYVATANGAKFASLTRTTTGYFSIDVAVNETRDVMLSGGGDSFVVSPGVFRVLGSNDVTLSLSVEQDWAINTHVNYEF